MQDSRILNLVVQETIKGLGAYWFILEKLALLHVLKWNICVFSVKLIKFLLLISRKSSSDTNILILKKAVTL